MFKRVVILMAVVCWMISLVQAAEHTKDSLKVVKENVDSKKAVLVDVREKSEWNAGHLEGAIPLPMSELNAGIDEKQLAKRLACSVCGQPSDQLRQLRGDQRL